MSDQGVLSTKEGYFLVSNFDKNQTTGTIYKLDKDFRKILTEVSLVDSELNLWNDKEYNLHLGQTTFNKIDQRIYISVMDISTPYLKLLMGELQGIIRQKSELYNRRTALISFDLNLQDFRWYDWSSISSYFDTIHFEDCKLWFDCGYLGVLDFKEFIENPSNLKVIKFDINRKKISKAQGLKIKNNTLYYIPEYDNVSKRTKNEYLGINLFDITKLLERKGILKVNNNPEIVYRFQIPKIYGDYEAMDFIIGSNQKILIDSGASSDAGKNLYQLQLK